MAKFFIQNEGDEDSNLWLVLDQANKVHYSTRDLNEANKWIKNNSRPNSKEMTPNSPNWENSFLSELAREMAIDDFREMPEDLI